jgi:hypothetical protein
MDQKITECMHTKFNVKDYHMIIIVTVLLGDTNEKDGKLTPFEFGIFDVIHP